MLNDNVIEIFMIKILTYKQRDHMTDDVIKRHSSPPLCL